MKVTIFKTENTRYLVGIRGSPAQETTGYTWLDTAGVVQQNVETRLHLERADLESLILQLSGQLAKLDQDEADKKVPA